MKIAILGRLPDLSIAELESVFGSSKVNWFSENSALVESDYLNVEKLGGTIKAGNVIKTLHSKDFHKISQEIIRYYSHKWLGHVGKITLGISAYGVKTTPKDIQKIGLILKNILKKSNTSLRLIPNNELFLSSAVSHHNKLGLSDNKIELLIIAGSGIQIIIAESTGAQNISALAKRDQGRPKRDAFVGMLPPKLAQIMVNLATGPHRHNDGISIKDGADTRQISLPSKTESIRLLDPFCGTGVILQEAALMGNAVYGTDLSEKMIRYTRDNLNWLKDSRHISSDWYAHEGDAMTTKWQQPIDAVASETYLGQPFSKFPSLEKLKENQQNCGRILSNFLKNISSQLKSGTIMCLAVPEWRDELEDNRVATFGLTLDSSVHNRLLAISFKNTSNDSLVYYRPGQVVSRRLYVIVKI